MAALVMELDEPYRRTVLLRYFEGLGPAAIAKQESLPLATVKTRLRRALERLRSEVDSRHSLGSQAWLLALAGKPASPAALPFLAAAAMKFPVLAATLALAVLGLGIWASQARLTAPAAQDPVTEIGLADLPAQESAEAHRTGSRQSWISELFRQVDVEAGGPELRIGPGPWDATLPAHGGSN